MIAIRVLISKPFNWFNNILCTGIEALVVHTTKMMSIEALIVRTAKMMSIEALVVHTTKMMSIEA